MQNGVLTAIGVLYTSLSMAFDVASIRRQFPILGTSVRDKPLIYLDSAATSQKPSVVVDTMTHFYTTMNANVNRGVHALAEEATAAHDDAREAVRAFLHAKHRHEIIFTKNATEAINLVARSFGDTLKKGDRIAISLLEHHSNIVPWLQLCERASIEIDWLPMKADGTIDIAATKEVLAKGKTKLVSVSGLSNVLGTRQPIEELTKISHENGAVICIDAAQFAAHERIDVQKLGCDFLAFSGHKIYGPTGIGVLFGRKELLEKMPPFLGGGDMIQTVTTHGFTVAELPRKFEAGTVAAADSVALAAAIRWMSAIGINSIQEHEAGLMRHAMIALLTVEGLKILGPTDPAKRIGCISFTIDGVHPHDLTDVLGRAGICLRAGHHCTQPLHALLGIPASARMSFGVYNTTEEIDVTVSGMNEAVTLLKK